MEENIFETINKLRKRRPAGRASEPGQPQEAGSAALSMSSTPGLKLSDSQLTDSLLGPGYGSFPAYDLEESSDDTEDKVANDEVKQSLLESVHQIKSSNTNERIWAVAVFSLIACLGSAINGAMGGYSSSTVVELRDIFQSDPVHGFLDTSRYASMFGAFGPLGAAFGSPFAWPASEWLGRQPALMLGGIPAVIGWLLITYAHFSQTFSGFLAVLLLGRILTGFAAGWLVFCVSIYIAEIASPRLKGLFGACNQLFTTIGIFLSLGLGALADNTNSFNYFYVSLVILGLIALFEVLMLYTCETPRWLYSKQRDLEGNKNLNLLRGPRANIPKEIRGIQMTLRNQKKLSVKEILMEFKKRSVYHPFLLVLMLMFFQQFSFINAAIYYAATIFQNAGVENASLVSALSIGGVQIVATVISVILVDLIGRKILLIISSVGMSLSSLVLGIQFLITDSICNGFTGGKTSSHRAICQNNIGWLAIVASVVFIVAFSMAWGPVPWLMMSELLPLRVRSIAGSIATFVNWGFATIVTATFQMYAEAVTQKFAWWSFALVMLMSIVCVILFLPETKGHSLEEIEEYFKQGPILSPRFSLKLPRGVYDHNNHSE